MRGGLDANVLLNMLSLVMSTIQTCFLAYLAARFRTPWDMTISAPKSPAARRRQIKEPPDG